MTKATAAALFSIALSSACGATLPALAHSLDDVQADLQQREKAVAFEPGEGSAFPAFRLQDADGKTVDLASLRGKVVVLDFISTGCTDGCPAQSDLMAQIQADIAAGQMSDQVELVSISLEPARDTAAARKAYGPAHGLKPENWAFLAGGTADEAERLAEAAGLKLERRAGGAIDRSIVTYVVDSAGKLRARFFGLKFDPLNLVVYVNALTNDHHELEPGHEDGSSFWQKLKHLL